MKILASKNRAFGCGFVFGFATAAVTAAAAQQNGK